MPYITLVNDYVAPDNPIDSFFFERLIDNLELHDSELSIVACHGWVASLTNALALPQYATAPWDFRQLPGMRVPLPAGYRRYRVRLLYRSSGDSRTSLQVVTTQGASDPIVLPAASTTAWSGEIVIAARVSEAVTQWVFLQVDTNGEDYTLGNDLQHSVFTPIGVCVIAEGGGAVLPDRESRYAGQPITAAQFTGIYDTQWALYRERRRVYACLPDDSQSSYTPAVSGLSASETHVSAPAIGQTRPALGVLVERRPDTDGVTVSVWVTPEIDTAFNRGAGETDPGLALRFVRLDGTVVSTDTQAPAVGRPELAGYAVPMASTSRLLAQSDPTADPVICGDATPVGAQMDLPSITWRAAWPTEVAVGDLVAVEVVIPGTIGGVWHASVSESYPDRPPRTGEGNTGRTTAGNIPTQWQPLSVPRGQLYPRNLVRSGSGTEAGVTFDYGPTAMLSDDRRLWATRMPVYLSRFRQAGLGAVNPTSSQGASSATFFDGVPFRTPSMSHGKLDCSVWLTDDGECLIEAIPLSGATQSVTLAASGGTVVEVSGQLTGLSASTWYRLRVSCSNAAGPVRLYGILVVHADLETVRLPS